jgi:hypothetical protein
MAISEGQLATWSNAGAQATAALTYASIKAALEAKDSPLPSGSFKVYLQGSYGNTTNIFGDSDVDVIVEQISSFGYDVARLNDVQKAEFHRAYPTAATYTFTQFRADVEQSLTKHYGSSLIDLHSKCTKVKDASGRLNADVIPCGSYRRYDPGLNPLLLPKPYEGIRFLRRDSGVRIVNFPKQHRDNAVAKNQATKELYKPAVRIFKNFRNSVIADGLLAAGEAPSYFLECLLYNVPNVAFAGSYSRTAASVLVWLGEACTTPAFDKLVTGSGLQWLFDSSETSWNKASAVRLILAYLKAWNS